MSGCFMCCAISPSLPSRFTRPPLSEHDKGAFFGSVSAYSTEVRPNFTLDLTCASCPTGSASPLSPFRQSCCCSPYLALAFLTQVCWALHSRLALSFRHFWRTLSHASLVWSWGTCCSHWFCGVFGCLQQRRKVYRNTMPVFLRRWATSPLGRSCLERLACWLLCYCARAPEFLRACCCCQPCCACLGPSSSLSFSAFAAHANVRSNPSFERTGGALRAPPAAAQLQR